MNTNNTTTPTDGAAWTEKELFRHFLTMTLNDYDAFGNIRRDYDAIICLSDPGMYGTLEDLCDQIIDDLCDDDEPEARLENLIEDLDGYISGLRKLHTTFGLLKQYQIILPPEPEETADLATRQEWDKAAYEAENNPRYRRIEPKLQEDNGVDFLELGDSPTSEPDFEEMTEADENSIRLAS